MKSNTLTLASALFALATGSIIAADPAPKPAEVVAPVAAPIPFSPAVLPGKGLAQHDFLYAGEAKNRRVFIVRNGQVVWTYDDPTGRGEISDAVLLSNGNLLIAHQFLPLHGFIPLGQQAGLLPQK